MLRPLLMGGLVSLGLVAGCGDDAETGAAAASASASNAASSGGGGAAATSATGGASSASTCSGDASGPGGGATGGAPPGDGDWACDGVTCNAGELCGPDGTCITVPGAPPAGAPPTCAAGQGNVPDWQCTGDDCGDLIAFEPVSGVGYENTPFFDETADNQYRSFLRRDLVMLIKYATAMVACQAGSWPDGNGGPLELGDMSLENGCTPFGEPAGTHANGLDIGTAYYQVGTDGNQLGPICDHFGDNASLNRCIAEPALLDAWRSALFIGHLHVSPKLRAVFVDGLAGPPIENALTSLCTSGYVTGTACTAPVITYGGAVESFFHHHIEITTNAR